VSRLSEEVPFITVVDVRDYAYCPRVVYFTRVLHLRERVTEAMEYGREEHEEPPLAPLVPRLKPAKIIRGVELTSRRLRLTGKVDMIVVTKHGEYVPVEVKWSEPRAGRPRRQHRAQLAAYALLIEDEFSTTVKRAIIYYSRAGKLMEVALTDHDKRQVKEFVDRIYEVIRSEEVPEVRQDEKQCRDCGYRMYCKA
jgi:CRISPR-associated exonuclease Cas4